MTRSKKIFLIVAVLFTLVVIAFALDMCSRTSPPWEKKKDSIKKYKVKLFEITKKKSSHTTITP
jgi:hypothetical protein